MDYSIILHEGIPILIVFLLYGMYSLITALSIYFLLHQNQTASHSRRLLLVVISAMFAIHTGLMAEVSICFFNDLKSIYQDVDGRLNLQAQLVEAVLARINYLLSDFVVVWRAWSLSEHTPRWRSRYVLSFCLCASFVALMIDGAFTIAALQSSREVSSFALSSIAMAVQQLGMMRIVLPLVLFVTNIVATAYIGMTFWEFRNTTRDCLAYPRHIVNIGQMLLFMFESGLIYSSIWILIIFAIVFVFPFNVTIALDLIIPQITAIYPALIILLKAAQKSTCEESERNTAALVMIRPSSQPAILTTQIQVDTIDVHFQSGSPVKSSATSLA